MNKLPLYKEVKNSIVQSLIDGEWGPGELMPSEPRLAQRYSVGINTIRAAVGELVAANILLRHQGKGTFVSQHASSQGIYRFFSIVRSDGQRDLPVRQFVSLRAGTADHKTAELLQLPRTRNGSKICKLTILFKLGGKAVGFTRVTLPCSLFRGLSERGFEDGSVSLYALYQANYAVSVIRITEMLGAVRADATTAKALGLRAGEPVLEVSRTAYTFNDRPVELRRMYVDTRNYRYLVDHGAEM